MTLPEVLLTGGGASTFTILAGKVIDKLPLFNRTNGKHGESGKCPHPNEVKILAIEITKQEIKPMMDVLNRLDERVQFLYEKEIK